MDDPGWLIALGFFALAGGLWAFAWRKERRGRHLLAQARELEDAAAVPRLVAALQAAEETPDLEETILAELGRRYRALGLAWDPAPYRKLVGQYRRLAGWGTGGAAHTALVDGQELKRRLRERFPRP